MLVTTPAAFYNNASTNFAGWIKEVACPYFMPVSKLENGSWPHPARLPLGCGWHGHCTSPGHEGQTPAQDVLEKFCNLGYSGSCGWSPPQREWDSVRFALATRGDSARSDTTAPIIRLTYVCEKDHRPVAHGELHFDLPRAAWIQLHPDARVQKMAECFLDSYLKKKA